MSRRKNKVVKTVKPKTMPSRIPKPCSLDLIFDLLARLDLNGKLTCILLFMIRFSLPGLLSMHLKEKRPYLFENIQPEAIWKLLPGEEEEERRIEEFRLKRQQDGYNIGPALQRKRRELNPKTRDILRKMTTSGAEKKTCDKSIELLKIKTWRIVDTLLNNIDEIMSHPMMRRISIQAVDFDYSQKKNAWSLFDRGFEKLDIDLPKICVSPAWYDLEKREEEIRCRIKTLFANVKNSRENSAPALRRATKLFSYDEKSDDSFSIDCNSKLHDFVSRSYDDIIVPFRRVFSDFVRSRDIMSEPDPRALANVHFSAQQQSALSVEFAQIITKAFGSMREPAPNQALQRNDIVNSMFMCKDKTREINVSMLEKALAVKHVIDRGRFPENIAPSHILQLQNQQFFWFDVINLVYARRAELRLNAGYALAKDWNGDKPYESIYNYFVYC